MMFSLPGYVIERPLGRGRTGEVFRALREAYAIPVAVRRILPALSAAPGVAANLRGLKGECSVLRAATVVPVAEVVEHEGDLFVIEQFVDGVPLSVKLAKGGLEPDEVHALAMDLMDALADLHRQRVVHGDLRPSNVFLTSRGARLVGVGVAHRTKRRKGGGSFLLRDPYDAPEMDQGVASHLSDIYGLAAVLMHAVTGEEGPYDFLSETDEVTDELLKAMSPAPEHRHGNVEALRLAFTDAEKRRGPVKQRTAPVPEPHFKPAAPAPWPEEDDVATRADMPAIGPKAAALGRPKPSRAPSTPPSPAEPRVDQAISARKEGTVAPGERFEEFMERARGWAPIAGAATGGVLLLAILGLVLMSDPDDMLRLEIGSVELGDPGGQADERPGLRLSIAPFWLDKTEVRASDYTACMRDGKCTAPTFAVRDETLPMTGITWLQAQSYCTWADKRLPTENEWEAAARSAGRYPWGDAAPECGRARYGLERGGPCATEGGLPGPEAPPDPEELDEDAGFAHLAGNVWEFVDADHQPARGAGTGQATVAGQSTLRVIKGGAWSAGPEHLRPAARMGVRTDYAAEDVGFRCARDD